jgi:hypothetical protein
MRNLSGANLRNEEGLPNSGISRDPTRVVLKILMRTFLKTRAIGHGKIMIVDKLPEFGAVEKASVDWSFNL